MQSTAVQRSPHLTRGEHDQIKHIGEKAHTIFLCTDLYHFMGDLDTDRDLLLSESISHIIRRNTRAVDSLLSWVSLGQPFLL